MHLVSQAMFFISMLVFVFFGIRAHNLHAFNAMSYQTELQDMRVVIYPAAQQKNKSLFYHLFILF